MTGDLSDRCKKCSKKCDPRNRPAFTCRGSCERRVHLSCLDRGSAPSNLIGDVFFEFHCSECHPLKQEIIIRDKMSWLTVVMLTLYNLREKSSGISRRGYFHWKSNISSFIELNWDHLLKVKKRKNWIGTISGILSHYSGIFFQSGTTDLGDQGWWKLMSDEPPEVLVEMYNKYLENKKQNASQATMVSTEPSFVNSFTKKGKNGYQSPAEPMDVDEDKNTLLNDPSEDFGLPDIDNFLNIDPDNLINGDVDDTNLQRDSFPNLFFGECLQNVQEDISQKELIEIQKKVAKSQKLHENLKESKKKMYNEGIARKGSHVNVDLSNEESNASVTDDYYEEDEEDNEVIDESGDNERKNSHKNFVCQSLFHVSIKRPYPWVKEVKSGEIKPLMSETEEEYLYRQMEKHKSTLDDAPACVKRFYRKLVVRRLKRQNRIPLLNVDNFDANSETRKLNQKKTRQLDRFVNVDMPSFFEHRLQGYCKPTSVHSPYTNRLLKPYIRRDVESRPLWMMLMCELLHKSYTRMGIHQPEFFVAPIDYSYIRPQHISALNSLCARYFWPGIDLSECLQYPDFTCVVLYKKMIIGFATMVPDVGLNEAYISFLFTRPEWRNAGIGTFMLYHLIQTCMGKDITLHVSATNSALILYQKFGFKIEEFVQDFYDKYMPPSSRDCRHALFLRLAR